MRRAFALLACSFATACWTSTAARRVVVSSIPEPAAPATRTDGPLSLRARVPETPWPVAQELRRQADAIYLDGEAVRVDTAHMLRLVDELFPAPEAPELRLGVAITHRDLVTLERLAPCSLESVATAFMSNTRLPLCVRAPGAMAPCYTRPT